MTAYAIPARSTGLAFIAVSAALFLFGPSGLILRRVAKPRLALMD